MSTEKDPFKAYCDHIKGESSTQYSLPQLPYPMGYWNRRAGWLGGGVERRVESRRVPRIPESVVRVTHFMRRHLSGTFPEAKMGQF